MLVSNTSHGSRLSVWGNLPQNLHSRPPLPNLVSASPLRAQIGGARPETCTRGQSWQCSRGRAQPRRGQRHCWPKLIGSFGKMVTRFICACVNKIIPMHEFLIPMVAPLWNQEHHLNLFLTLSWLFCLPGYHILRSHFRLCTFIYSAKFLPSLMFTAP